MDEERLLKLEWKGDTKQQTREKNIKRRYNMTFMDLVTLLEAQGFKCAVSHVPIDAFNCVVDHEHISGIVRGLLTNETNTALGLLKDDVETLKRAIKYLEEFEEWKDESV